MQSLILAFVSAFQMGCLPCLGLAPDATINGLPAIATYDSHFATTTERSLVLRNVRWNEAETRATADFTAMVDDTIEQGSLTFYSDGASITKVVFDDVRHTEYERSLLADAGQMADKGSTAVGLSTHAVTEANPLLSGLGAGGMVAFGAIIVGVRELVVRDLPLTECIEATRALSAVGWGAAANNVAVLTGVGAIVAPVAGVIAGIVAYNAEYKGECVDGPVRLSFVSSGSTN